MKNIFSTLLILFAFTSCDLPLFDADKEKFGFYFLIVNYTSEYPNAEITIGSFKEEVFIPSDTLKLPIISGYDSHSFLYNNRWQPNLENIEKAYFKIRLNDEREEFIYEGLDINNVELMYLDTSENKKISNHVRDDISHIRLAIYEDIVEGRGSGY